MTRVLVTLAAAALGAAAGAIVARHRRVGPYAGHGAVTTQLRGVA